MSRRLTALSLRFACDQQNRQPMESLTTDPTVIIYRGSPYVIQAAVFDGIPASETFVDEIDTVTLASLVIRKNNERGIVLIEKVLASDVINDSLTYEQWADRTSQHFQFELSATDTNHVVPSDGTLDIYGAIEIETSSGGLTIGIFQGQIKEDGIGNPGTPTMPDFTSYSKAEVDALLAASEIGVTTKYSALLGDSVSVSYNVTHSLNSENVIVQVHKASAPKDVVFPDVTIVDANTITLSGFAVAPALNSLRVTVV